MNSVNVVSLWVVVICLLSTFILVGIGYVKNKEEEVLLWSMLIVVWVVFIISGVGNLPLPSLNLCLIRFFGMGCG